MTNSYKSNLFVLLMIIHQFVLSFFWGDIVNIFSLTYEMQLILTQILVFILPVGLYFFITKESIPKTLSIKPLKFKNILFVVAISIFIQPLMSLLSALSLVFFPNNVSEIVTEMNQVPMTIMIISMSVFPSIGEEVFFRGVVFSGYRNVSFKKAALMTGLLFGIMHMDGQQFLYAFAMGMIFCYFVYKTKSIFASVISHFTINASQLALSRWAADYNSANNIETEVLVQTSESILMLIASTVILFIMSLPMLVLLFYYFRKYNTPKTPLLEIVSEEVLDYSPLPPYEEKVLNLPFWIIVSIYLTLIIILPTLIYFIS